MMVNCSSANKCEIDVTQAWDKEKKVQVPQHGDPDFLPIGGLRFFSLTHACVTFISQLHV